MNLTYVAPFIEKMGNPAEYVYEGECIDLGVTAGNCVCGHPIRYEFIVHNHRTGQSAILGSECINHFEIINPTLYKALLDAHEKMLADIKERERIAKELALDAQIAPLKIIYDTGISTLKSVYTYYFAQRSYKNWCPVPGWLYWGIREVPDEPKLKRKGAILKWYERNQKKVNTLLTQIPQNVKDHLQIA